MPKDLDISFDERDWARIRSKLSPELLTPPMKRFLTRSALVVHNRGKANAPVNTGRLRASINYEVDTGKPPLWAKIGTNVFYAPYQEYGTGLLAHEGARKRHWPPGGALDDWAKKHGAPSGMVVARAIGRRGGLRPKLFLTKGKEDSLSDINGFLNDAKKDIKKIWDDQRWHL